MFAVRTYFGQPIYGKFGLQCGSEFVFTNYLHQVYDCLVISKTKEENKVLFDELNRLHSVISFTREIKENNELPFLDILILRKNNNFLTTIYMKISFTGQHLNYHLFCIKRQKINLIKTIYHREYKICSTCLLETETNKIKDILMNNGYPYSSINKGIKLHSDRLRKMKSYGPQKLHVTLKLPFVGKKIV